MQGLLSVTLILLAGCSVAAVMTAAFGVPTLLGYQQSFAAALGLTEQVMSALDMPAEIVERNISAMRHRPDSGNFAGSPSS